MLDWNTGGTLNKEKTLVGDSSGDNVSRSTANML